MHVGNTGWCSAYGKCNIFCCNCENGCRTGDKKKKIFKELVKTPKEEFDLIDKNKDGFISFEAALEYANSHLNEIDRGNITDLSQDRSWFTFMDSNGDDKVTPHEFDSSL
uniref:EF-hand domain-containing protein n=1 Tax=Panagrolaimus sp. PS1159 TaxID=55785 RepID=A0AC35F909_9BILA